MNKRKNTIPEFKSEEQEAEYWDQHSPLDMVAEPDMQKIQVRSVKDRPIAIRLDSQTRARLNALAAKQGMGPSTLARHILYQVLENTENSDNTMDLEGLMKSLSGSLAQVRETKAGYDVPKINTSGFNKPPELVFQGQKKDWDDFSSRFLKLLLAVSGIRVTIVDQTENRDYM